MLSRNAKYSHPDARMRDICQEILSIICDRLKLSLLSCSPEQPGLDNVCNS